MPEPVFYWHGVLNPFNKEYSDYLQAVIQKLLNGEYAAAKIEKLRGYRIFSARIDAKDRVIFTTISFQGKSYLLIIDVVLQHRYGQSKFLQAGVLQHFLEKEQERIETAIRDEDFASVNGEFLTEFVTQQWQSDFKELQYYQKKFISFCDEQNDALQRSLPLILSGGPGSGKTCIALKFLQQLLEQENAGLKVYYLADSIFLVQKMAQMWEELPHAPDQDEKIVFCTFADLFFRLNPQAPRNCLVSKAYFFTWFKEHFMAEQKSLSKVNKTQEILKLFEKNPEKLYQEWRLISGYCSKEEYSELGIRYSSYGKEVKSWVWEAFTRYTKYLAKNNKIDLAFYRFNTDEHLGSFIVDEAQNDSHGQLREIFRLSRGKIGVFCDTNQRTEDAKSIGPFFQDLCFGQGLKAEVVNFEFSHRNPPQIIELLNAISSQKRQITQGTLDNEETPILKLSVEQKKRTQEISCFMLDTNSLALLNKLKNCPNFAIVTQEKYKEKIRALIPTVLVYTVREIQGLEYPLILTYGLLDEPLLKEANRHLKLIGKSESSEKDYLNRANKEDGEFAKYAPAINAFYIACSRATQALLVCENFTHDIEILVEPWVQILKRQPLDFALIDKYVATDAAPDWNNELIRQLEQGNFTVAEEIFLTHLNGTGEEFAAIKKRYLPATTEANNKTQKDASTEVKSSKKRKKKKKGAGSTNNQPILVANEPYSEINLPKINQAMEKFLKAKTFSLKLFNNLVELAAKNNISRVDLYLSVNTNTAMVCLLAEIFNRPHFYEDWLKINDDIQVSLLRLCQPCNKNSMPALFYLLQAIPCTKDDDEYIDGHFLYDLIFSELRINDHSHDATLTAAIFLQNDKKESIFYLLVQHWSLLEVLIDEFPPIIQKINWKLLLQNIDNTCLLALLASSKIGHEILLTILKKHRDLVNNWNHKHFLINLKGTTVLFKLSLTMSGQDILKLFSEKNPKELMKFSHDNLSFTSVKNETVWFNLAFWENYSQLFTFILTKNPALAQGFSGELLCKTSSNNNSSIFWQLACPVLNATMLNFLFNHNPGLFEQITLSVLFTPAKFANPDKAKGVDLLGEPSAFANLASFEEGRKFLLRIFHNNTKICGAISATQVFRPSKLGVFPRIFSNETGFIILLILIKKNEAFRKEVDASILSTKITETKRTVMSHLCETTLGHEILGVILKDRANLTAEISSRMFSDEIDFHRSIINLSCSILGHLNFVALFNYNKKFHTEIKIPLLVKLQTEMQISLIFSLVSSETGFIVLRHLVYQNDSFWDLFMQNLNNKNEQQRSLFSIIVNLNDSETLINCIIKKSSLVSELSVETMLTIDPQTMQPPLFHLLKNKRFRKVIDSINERNSSFIYQISSAQLFRRYQNEDSIFLLLIKKSENKALIEKIFSNKQLLQEMQAEDIFPEDLTGYSGFDYLLDNNQEFLADIFAVNPHFLQEFIPEMLSKPTPALRESGLNVLSRTIMGCECFVKALEINQNCARKLTINMFFEGVKSSSFIYFLYSSVWINFIDLLKAQNPELLLALTPDHLLKKYSYSEDGQVCFLSVALGAKERVDNLIYLFKQNLDLVKSFGKGHFSQTFIFIATGVTNTILEMIIKTRQYSDALFDTFYENSAVFKELYHREIPQLPSIDGNILTKSGFFANAPIANEEVNSLDPRVYPDLPF